MSLNFEKFIFSFELIIKSRELTLKQVSTMEFLIFYEAQLKCYLDFKFTISYFFFYNFYIFNIFGNQTNCASN